mgnify:CR=1 FL=1
MELGLIESLVIFALLSLTAIIIVIIFFKTGKKEINPNEALVYKNQWTGKAKVKMAGTTILTPGINKEITRVSLKDEPHDPAETKINLSDGTEIGVDYVITKQKVVDPIKSAIEINYEDRDKIIRKRIEVFFQDELVKYSGKSFVLEEKENGKKTIKKKDEELKLAMETTETAVNRKIKDTIEKNWGIEVEIGIENFNLPPKLLEVAEEAATAVTEGERIKIKAQNAGVDVKWVFLGDIITDAIRAYKGEKGGK